MTGLRIRLQGNHLLLWLQAWWRAGGWARLPALACLALGLAAWAVWWPARLALSQAQALARAEAAQAEPVQRAAAGPARGAQAGPGQVSEVFADMQRLAQHQGLALGRIDYRWDDMPAAGAHGGGAAEPQRVQLGVPLRASYPALRAFLRALRRDQPAITLDQLTLQRVTVDEGGADGDLLEVRLALSLWLMPVLPVSPVSVPEASR